MSGMAAYGSVLDVRSQRAFVVEISRKSHRPELRRQILSRERHGFLNWPEDTEESS